MSLKEELKALLEDAVDETSGQMSMAADEAADYIAARAQHLAAAVGQAGFDEAVRAERNSVALHIGIMGVGNAAEVEARFVGIVHGALRIGAAMLA